MKEGEIIPYCPECGEEVKEGAKFCPKCGASLSDIRKTVDRRKTGITINRKVIASYGIMFGLFVMIIAVFLPWIHGVWGGSVDMVDVITGDNPLTGPTSLLGFFTMVQFLGEIGQIKSTVGEVPLVTSGKKKPTKLRYLAPLAIILCIVGFLWFFSEVSSASTEYISAWDLVGGGFWLFGLGFLLRVVSYAELVRR